MPDGLLYALSGKLSSDSLRVSAVVCENGPAMFTPFYIQEALGNCLEINEGNKPHVHLLLFANDAKCFMIPDTRARDVTVYNYARNPFVTLEKLYTMCVDNISSKSERSHLLIIDDYSIFSVLTCARDVAAISRFFGRISRKLRKMYLFFRKETLSAEEIAVAYNIATDVAYLQQYPDNLGGNCNNTKKFLCDLLKIRVDRRVTHDKTTFQMLSDGIKEELVRDSGNRGSSNSSDVFRNLTTFKLTLEDDEKESRSKLHLPYFEAQKTSLETPEAFEDYEEDEEDEEV